MAGEDLMLPPTPTLHPEDGTWGSDTLQPSLLQGNGGGSLEENGRHIKVLWAHQVKHCDRLAERPELYSSAEKGSGCLNQVCAVAGTALCVVGVWQYPSLLSLHFLFG